MPTFTATPDFPVSESSAPRVSRTAFPSYEQRATFGINPMQDTWDLAFSARDATERDGIYSFLKARAGVEPFTWETPFGETATFICSTWNTSLDSCNLSTIRASFELQHVPQGPNLVVPAAPTTAFSAIPDFVASQSYDTQARTFTFGDGYRQRIVMGLQPQREEWSLEFVNRTNAERNTIRDYLRGAKGGISFLWTDPRSGDTGRYVCAEWSVEYVNFNNNSIQATFRRVYEP